MSFLDTVATIGTLGVYNPGQDDANDALLASNRDQVTESGRQFDVEQEAIAPFRDIGLSNFRRLNTEANAPGQTAEGRLDRIRRSFRESPSFQNRLTRGRDTIEQGANAQGSLFSGDTQKGLETFRQDLAAEDFDKHADRVDRYEDSRLNRFASLAGAGQVATNQIIESGRNNSNNIIQSLQNRGQIQAAGATAPVSSFLNFANTGINAVRASQGA